LRSLYYFALDFHEQVLLLFFAVHQPFRPLSSLLHSYGRIRILSFNKVLLSVLFSSHFDLILAHFSMHSTSVSNKYLFISFFPDSHGVENLSGTHCKHSNFDFLFTPRFSLYLAAISVSLLHLTMSNIWKADLSLKSIWLTLSGNSLVPLQQDLHCPIIFMAERHLSQWGHGRMSWRENVQTL